MIYDCFTFFNELEMLELRLNTLDKYVDKFVLVEATKTFTGKDKPLYYNENKHLFENFNDRIIHVIVDTYPNSDNPWFFECNQRNSIANGLVNCNDDDVILISDLDEIPRPEYIVKYKDEEGVKLFEQDFHMYYINCVATHKNIWLLGTKMLSYYDFKHLLDNEEPQYNGYISKEMNIGTTASLIRDYKKLNHIPNGGWHFTYLGGAEKLKQKFEAYSHTEFVESGQAEIQNLIKRIDRHAGYIPRKIDSNYPQYVIDNMEKYHKFILKVSLKDRFEFLGLKFVQFIFDKHNEYVKFQKYKVITILGITFKFKWRQRG